MLLKQSSGGGCDAGLDVRRRGRAKHYRFLDRVGDGLQRDRQSLVSSIGETPPAAVVMTFYAARRRGGPAREADLKPNERDPGLSGCIITSSDW